MIRHAELLVEHFGEKMGMNLFRKHPPWYLKGFPAGAVLRDSLARVSSIDELEALVADLDPDVPFPEEAHRMVRGHSHGPRPVRLPQGFLTTRHTEGLSRESAQPVSGG